jgi:hypothetical protein
MKTPLFVWICLWVCCKVSAQSISSETSLPRSGDRLLKREVSVCRPGGEGRGQVWDFRELELPDANYELNYFAQGNDTLVGVEHRTLYYYRSSGDSLFCIGYENPTTFVAYQRPELLLAFPLFQGRTLTDYFDGSGSYCDRLSIRLRGKSTVSADASGVLLLPGCDTLVDVLRTCTHKRIHQQLKPLGVRKDKPAGAPAFDRDSIESLLAGDSIRIETRTWRWYARGYRYPVLETIQSQTYKFEQLKEELTTSFIYLPEEQYYNLAHDAANQERRDRAAAEAERRQAAGEYTQSGGRQDEAVAYRFGMDEDGNLHIDYTLKQPSDVALMLYDMQGRQYSRIHRVNQAAGSYRETLSMGRVPRGEYLLRIVAGKEVFGEKILKL